MESNLKYCTSCAEKIIRNPIHELKVVNYETLKIAFFSSSIDKDT